MASNSDRQISKQLEPWSNLDGKVVLITGASSGLGWEFCIKLASVGCKVIAAARRVERLKSLCDHINQSSSTTARAVALELDVTAGPLVVEAAVQKAWSAFGHIDALINNAGIRGGTSSAIDLTKEEWDDVFKTNLEGAWLCSKYVAIRMREAGKGGSIINISSIFGLSRVQSNGSVAYSSSKTAMHAMTSVMALDFGKHNIRVNVIAPALFKSEITKIIFKNGWHTNVVKKTVPLGSITGSPDPALTSVLRYLIHDSSKYVTGNVFIVDAGTTLVNFETTEPWSNLDGKVVLITSGLGWEFCIKLASIGCKVTAAARCMERLKSLCDRTNQSSSTTRAVALELDDTNEPLVIEAAVQKAWTAFGQTDALINNAGIRGGTSSTTELTKQECVNVFKTNLEGAWLCSKYVEIWMRDAGKGGSIINISSIFGVGRVQSNGSLAYSSLKSAMHAMTSYYKEM